MSLSATPESSVPFTSPPRTRALDDPPPLRGTPQPNGPPTPIYALAWACERMEILGTRDKQDVEREIMSNWGPENGKYGYGLSPHLNLAEDEYIYAIVGYNITRKCLDLAVHDPNVVIMARNALKIQEKDEYTLKWYRFPIKEVEGVDNRANPVDQGRTTSRGKMTSS
ncbi:hypothetical protein BDN72DRAFT_833588 [Pluteus cervinus]|uniref:Uncharacterized protein n=1 Tax=Pluteus cervinus TaxID=181527 RepID=A0ACD3B8T9_9AGAR|nr:hypothetical protein BDN72DRAFT_833588 [Pluteus cervinus]